MEEMAGNVSKGETLPSPLDKMPDCWKDDMRMNSLFAPFRQRTVNPLDWDSKLKFWKTVINDWCHHKASPSFTLIELRKAFQRDGRTPLCLPTVIETLLRDNELCLYSDFVNITPEKSWTAWTVDVLMKKPLVWSFNKVKGSIVSTSVRGEDEYVNLAVAKSRGEALLAGINDHQKGQLYEYEELSALYKDQTGSVQDISLAIHWLQRQGKVAITNAAEGSCSLIKLASSTEKRAVITELDLGVYALKRNEKALTKHLEQLELEKQLAVEEARSFLKKGMRQVAKSSLRKKHELEKSIIKRAAALENVQVLLCRLKEAETDSKVLDAYKMGLAALKATFKEAGLTEDSVAHTVTDVEEVLDIHDEIQTMLSQPIGISADEDLEEELAELLSSESPPPSSPSPKKSSPKEDKETDLEERLRALRTSFPEPPSMLPTSQTPKVLQSGRH